MPPAPRLLTAVAPAILLALLAVPAVWAQGDGGPLFSRPADDGLVLVHYWNFDSIPNDVDFPATDKELLNAASHRYGAFLSYGGARWDRVNDPTPMNEREAPYDPELDRALRLRNPAGALTIDLPTTGFRDVRLRYAVSRSADGAELQRIAYSLDGGASFTTTGLTVTEVAVMAGTWTLVDIDFSGIDAVDNIRRFVVRLTMAGNGSGPDVASGNQRINNLTLDGYPIPRPPAGTLIHYWGFDSIPNDVDFPTGQPVEAGGVLGGQSTVKGAWIRYDGARWDRVNDPTPLNARATPYRADDDRAIRVRSPAGAITLRLPTAGHADIVVRYAVRRSGSGAARQEIAYSTDGSTFVTTGLPYSTAQVGENWVLHELDFSAIPAAGNNPNFTLRFTPSGPGSGKENIEGNQRLDHISVEARPLAGGK